MYKVPDASTLARQAESLIEWEQEFEGHGYRSIFLPFEIKTPSIAYGLVVGGSKPQIGLIRLIWEEEQGRWRTTSLRMENATPYTDWWRDSHRGRPETDLKISTPDFDYINARIEGWISLSPRPLHTHRVNGAIADIKRAKGAREVIEAVNWELRERGFPIHQQWMRLHMPERAVLSALWIHPVGQSLMTHDTTAVAMVKWVGKSVQLDHIKLHQPEKSMWFIKAGQLGSLVQPQKLRALLVGLAQVWQKQISVIETGGWQKEYEEWDAMKALTSTDDSKDGSLSTNLDLI